MIVMQAIQLISKIFYFLTDLENLMSIPCEILSSYIFDFFGTFHYPHVTNPCWETSPKRAHCPNDKVVSIWSQANVAASRLVSFDNK